MKKLNDEERVTSFWSKVEKTETCWLWTGAKNSKGRANFWDGAVVVLASHFAWKLVHGKYPKRNVLHTCDNPACVRYEHFFEGTQQDNMDDAYTKGRRTRLAPEIVECILEQAKAKVPQLRIAAEFNLSQTYVSQIISGKRGIHAVT